MFFLRYLYYIIILNIPRCFSPQHIIMRELAKFFVISSLMKIPCGMKHVGMHNVII